MITNRNHNKGRRFLDPFGVESQYITEDRGHSPDLLLWIDFTDADSLRSGNSGGAAPPTHNQTIMIANNKSFDTNSAAISAPEKSLSQYVIQTVSAKMPTYNTSGKINCAKFDGSQFLLASGPTSVGGVSGGCTVNDFSTSTIDSEKFTVYIACERLDKDGRNDVLFITDKDSSSNVPNHWMSFYFDESNRGVFEMYNADLPIGQSYRYVRYDDADDGNFHYHMFNAYEQYSNTDNYGSLQADGLFHQFNLLATDPGMPNPKYDKIISDASSLLEGKGGTLSHEFDFTGAGQHHSSITIGGQPQIGSETPGGTFRGNIYEILVFKSEHAGGNALDDIFFSSPFKKRWSNMLYYFQRKYQYISVKI